MKLTGITMVRNEVDIIATTLRYHLGIGCDEVLVVDNGSRDGTDRLLKQLADRDPRVRWRRDEGGYRQGEILTELAREARDRGADWVFHFDADQFWWCRSADIRSVLERADAAVLRTGLVNFVQRRSQRRDSPHALRHMTFSARPVGTVEEAHDLVNARKIAFVEIRYPTNVMTRTAPEMVLAPGSHAVLGVEGAVVGTEEIVSLHAPLRSRQALERQVETGKRVEEALPPGTVWQARRWKGLREGGDDLEAEWRANSHESGALDVYGRPVQLVPDRRLRDAVAPYLPPRWRRSRA